MPRGKMLRTKIREEIIASRAVAIAVEQARASVYNKQEEKKPLQVSLREHLGKIIDRIDPLETIAVISATYCIKQGVNWAGYWTDAFIQQPWRIGLELAARLPIGGLDVFRPLWEGIPKLPQSTKTVDQEIFEWAISYTIAYFIIHNGMDIASGILPVAMKILAIK